jgi:2-C-methyl-D-erythritol 4-phosphate cytidylyltransferase
VDAILLAAGSSSRLGPDIDKQLHRVNQKPLIIYSARRLLSHVNIDRLIVASRDNGIDALQEVFKEFGLLQDCEFVSGGKERQESVQQSLKAVRSDRVLLHEGARPLISDALIERVLSPGTACVTPTVPLPFTVAIGDTFMGKELDRRSLHNIQLPQAFDTTKLIEAHTHASSHELPATDDSALIFRMGHSVKFVEGEVTNIKVTYPSDLVLVESIINESGSF